MSKDKRRVGVHGTDDTVSAAYYDVGCDHLSWEHTGMFSHRCADCNEWLSVLKACDQCDHLEMPKDVPEGAVITVGSVDNFQNYTFPEHLTSTTSNSSFVTKDSGKREEYDSGMQRDTQEGKARFDLLFAEDVPYTAQFITRVAELLARGAEKYDPRNWEKAQGTEELERFKASAMRHMVQWMSGDVDEDHASAVVFNLLGYETTKWKMSNG